MKVKIRHTDQADGVLFTEINYYELDDLIGFVKKSGGFYYDPEGFQPFHSYQLVLDEGEAYAEIIVGEENE